jgi:hypothetical protein
MDHRRLVIFILLLLPVYSSAQMKLLPKEKVESVANPKLSPLSANLKFEKTDIKAPVMNEDDSPADFIFRFKNVGDKPLKIHKIISTCTCAKAVAEDTEIQPGKESSIRLTYNPKGHPGKFNRRVFVYCDTTSNPAAVLSLSVEVENSSDLSGLYPVQMGKIRLRRSQANFHAEKKAEESLRFINLSGKPLKLEAEKMFLPPCLGFRTEPEVVADSQEGMIVISYNPEKGRPAQTEIPLIIKMQGTRPSESTIKVIIEK